MVFVDLEVSQLQGLGFTKGLGLAVFRGLGFRVRG